MGSNDQVAESAPSFTAVNGHASTSPPGTSKINGDSHRDDVQDSDSRPSRPASAAQSHVPSPATLYHSPMAHPQSNQAPGREGVEESRVHQSNLPSRTGSQPSRNGDTSPLKRKRSNSPDHSNSNGATYGNHNPPPSPEATRCYNMDHERPSKPQNEAVLAPYHSGPSQPGPRDHREQYPRQEYVSPPRSYQQPDRHHYDYHSDPHAAAHAAAQQPRPYLSEAQLADALRRENGNYDQGTMGGRESFVSPDQDDQGHGPYDGEYGTPRSTASQMELDRKRRKRVFSNRTKTGCMTCRRRKKKCDEQHPECKF